MKDKIIGLHTADIHFDIKTNHQIDENGYPKRLSAALHAFDQLINTAKTDNVDFVIIAGDIFHTSRPSILSLLEFARKVKDLSQICSVYILPGNHDQTAIKNAVNSLDIFNEVFKDNQSVLVINENKWIKTTTKSGKTFIMHFLTWLSSIEERRQYLKETIKDSQFQLENSKYPQVLTAHGVAAGAKTGFGFDVDAFSREDDFYSIKELTVSQPQYVALGHIHKFQVVYEDIPVLYSGSLHDCDFGEANYDKGFVKFILDSANPTKNAEYEFIPVKQLQKYSSLNIKNIEDVEKQVKKLSASEKTGIIRFVCTDRNLSQTLLDEKISELLPDAQNVVIKYDSTITEQDVINRVRDESFQTSIGIEDAFQKHFENHELNVKIQSKLTELLNKII